MKKISILALSALLALSLCGCRNGNTNNNSTSTSSTTTAAATTGGIGDTTSKDESNTSASSQSGENSESGKEGMSAKTVLSAVSAAYGDKYLPNSPVPDVTLKELYGLDSDLYIEVEGEMPTFSLSPDRVIIVKAVSGKADKVEELLNEAKEKMLEEESMSLNVSSKLKASQIVKNGDFVAFIMTGDDIGEDVTDEAEALKNAKAQVQIGVDAFNSCFGTQT